MDRIQTYVANQQILAADLNDIQDQAVGTVDGEIGNILRQASPGMRACSWIQTNSFTDGTLELMDSAHDWRDYILYIQYIPLSGGASAPPGSGDYLYSLTPTLIVGYTGLGAYRSGGVLAPANGYRPVPASDASWATQVVTNFWVYAHPTTGNLYAFNDTGGALPTPHLFILGRKAGVRP